jgi:hypothetical protein
VLPLRAYKNVTKGLARWTRRHTFDERTTSLSIERVPPPMTPAGTTVDPTDTAAVRDHLARFAGDVSEREDGAIVADFRGVTHVTVHPDGRVETGMPLHEFAGRPDRLVFDHDAGELHVLREGESYTFRRP